MLEIKISFARAQPNVAFAHPIMPSKVGPQRRTHPFVWCAAIICTVITVAVIIVGIVTFIGYLVIHPRIPYISVIDSHLDNIRFDYAGVLEIQVTIVVRAQNDNEKAHVGFSDTSFTLSLDGVVLAELVADPFEVGKNNSVDFHYVVQSSPVSLEPKETETVALSLKQDSIKLDLKGSSRARWRVGIVGSVRFLIHLNCQLHFHPITGTYVPSPCTSKAK